MTEKDSLSLIGLDYPSSSREILRSLPHRVLALLWKILSMQGLVLLGTGWLVFSGKLDSLAWIIVAIVLLFGRAGLDIVKELKK